MTSAKEAVATVNYFTNLYIDSKVARLIFRRQIKQHTHYMAFDLHWNRTADFRRFGSYHVPSMDKKKAQIRATFPFPPYSSTESFRSQCRL